MGTLTRLRFPLGIVLGAIALLVAWVAVPLGLILAGIFGAIGIQLIVDSRPHLLETGDWLRHISRALRVWGIALGSIGLVAIVLGSVVWLASGPPPPGMPAPGVRFIIRLAILYVLAFAIAAVIAVWWPKVLGRVVTDGMRPGYIIGGVTWALCSLVRTLSWLPLVWRPDHLRDWFVDSSAQVELLLLPLLLAFPTRILYAGLPQRGADRRAFALRRTALVAMLVLGILGVAVGVIFEMIAAAPLFMVELTVAAWVIALIWAINLWRSVPREVTSA